MGTFIPKWVDRLHEKAIRPQRDLRCIKKFLRVVAAGARLVMREFARLKEISEGDARELRQLSLITNRAGGLTRRRTSLGRGSIGTTCP